MFKKLFYIIEKKIASQNKYVEILRRGGVKIGSGCVIDKTAIFGTEPYLIYLGNNVRITHGVKFITHDGSLWVLRNLGILSDEDKMGKIIIKDNCNIGWDTIIMPGVTIGPNTIVGAGSIVTKDIPANSVAVGGPAKVIESIYDYNEKNLSRYVHTYGMDAEGKRKILESVDCF